MATSTIKTRIKHKIGTATEWQTAATNSNFKPLEGELIIYEDTTTPRLKVGDGSKLVTELPFIDGIKVTVSGSGNAITAASYDENTRTLTLTKGASYTNNSGDITGVTAGNGLTGGATSGNATLNVGAGSGITVAADAVSVNTSYTTSGKNYKVAVDGTTGGLYVNVPWTDNNTTYSAATTSAAGLMSATDKKRVDSFAGSYDLGNMSNKTIADLQTALDTWLNSYSDIRNATATFSADKDWIAGWNSGNTASIISAGGRWTVTIIAGYNSKAYTQLRFAYYSDEQVVYIHRSNNTWGTAHKAAFKDDLDSKQNTITGAATTITGSNLTASRALVSDSNGKVAVSAVTSTELGYLDGVTSNV